jgi:cold-inducible RNA-binding protein
MGSKLFVGNLSETIDDPELERMFAEYGVVHAAHVVRDLRTGLSRGFGFVEMENAEEAQAALQQKCIDGRFLIVNSAHPPRSGSCKRRGYLGRNRPSMRPRT